MDDDEIDPNDLEPRFLLYVSAQELVAIGDAIIIAKHMAKLPVGENVASLFQHWEALDSFSRKSLAALAKDENTHA